MAGTYIEGNSEPLSGVYSVVKAAVEEAAAGQRGIVAYPFTSNWGPVNELVTSHYSKDFNASFNAEKTSLTASKIFKHAYKGKPKTVIGYRMATATAAKGTAKLNDAEAGVALELETLYPSNRAFTVVVKDGLDDGKVLSIVEEGVKLVEVAGDTVDALAATLNVSDYVRVKSKGAALPANTAGVEFTGGNNGEIVTATEYAAFLEELEADATPSAFSLDGVTDDAIIETVKEWLKRVRQEGFYTTFVTGGPLSWDVSLDMANAKSLGFNFNGIVNVGNGCDDYSAADMAIFIAARVASVNLNGTLTDETTPYTKVNRKLKPPERKAAKAKGTLVFTQTGDGVEIDEAVNTLTDPPEGLTKEFGKIRVNNTMDYITKSLEVFGNEYKKTRSNTAEARETYAATIEDSFLKPLAGMEVIQEGYFYRPDPAYHGKDAEFKAKIDEAFFYADMTPIDSMERIYQKIGVRF